MEYYDHADPFHAVPISNQKGSEPVVKPVEPSDQDSEGTTISANEKSTAFNLAPYHDSSLCTAPPIRSRMDSDKPHLAQADVDINKPNILDENGSVAVKRAHNTLAARKSREKRMKRTKALENEVANLQQKVDRWKQTGYDKETPHERKPNGTREGKSYGTETVAIVSEPRRSAKVTPFSYLKGLASDRRNFFPRLARKITVYGRWYMEFHREVSTSRSKRFSLQFESAFLFASMISVRFFLRTILIPNFAAATTSIMGCSTGV